MLGMAPQVPGGAGAPQGLKFQPLRVSYPRSAECAGHGAPSISSCLRSDRYTQLVHTLHWVGLLAWAPDGGCLPWSPDRHSQEERPGVTTFPPATGSSAPAHLPRPGPCSSHPLPFSSQLSGSPHQASCDVLPLKSKPTGLGSSAPAALRQAPPRPRRVTPPLSPPRASSCRSSALPSLRQGRLFRRSHLPPGLHVTGLMVHLPGTLSASPGASSRRPGRLSAPRSRDVRETRAFVPLLQSLLEASQPAASPPPVHSRPLGSGLGSDSRTFLTWT